MQSRVENTVQWIRGRIERRVLRAGQRVPSVRALAATLSYSPYTVAEAYERLVAQGLLRARRGSGYYVAAGPDALAAPRIEPARIDLGWLMHHMLASGTARGPGLGVLPPSWLDGVRIAASLRALGRERTGAWLESGAALGFAPLRALLQRRLTDLQVMATPEQILLTTGVTQALDLVLRSHLIAGDTALVPDPCWFGAIGIAAARGLRVIAVPCTSRGIDLDALEHIARRERPKLFIISAAAHNPTGISLSRQAGLQLLVLARRYDFLIFEDDVYADLCAPGTTRLAALDQLERVVYASSFSKTLASNLRVGYLAAHPDRLERIADAKILGGFTTPALNERLVHKLLLESRFGRRMVQLRMRLARQREACRRLLESAGIQVFGAPQAGMFLWVNMGRDTNELAIRAREAGLLLAPGSLFSPAQSPSEWMRFNITTSREDVLSLLRLAD